jgi:outer membrane protein OmpA-like peptidoglycan-associated protein
VAAVIRGYPPESIRTTLKEAVEGVHLRYADELKNFDGDTDVFLPVEYELRSCLQSAYQDQGKKKPVGRWWPRFQWGLVAVLMVAALTWLGLQLRRRGLERDYRELLATPETVELELRRGLLRLRGQAHDEWISHAIVAAPALRHVDRVDTTELANQDQRWLDCLAALRDEPGIIVTSAWREETLYYVEGLQDPLARQADTIINDTGLKPGQVRSKFRSYHSMEPEFVMARVQQSLGDVPTVRWTQHGSRLTATGSAPHAWCVAAKRYAEQSREVQIDVGDVADIDRTALLTMKRALEQRAILHADGTSQLADGQEGLLDEIAAEIVALMDAAAAIDAQVHVIVLGFADEQESRQSPPQTLSDSRSRFIWKELTKRGVPGEYLLIRARGTGQIPTTAAEHGVADRRRCMFNVRLALRSS